MSINNNKNYFQILFVFLLTLAVASVFARLGIDVGHQGSMFKPAVDLLDGKALFRDSYFQYGPLTALLQAFSLKLFGRYLIVIQLETAFFYALTSILLWLIWSRFLKPVLVTLICIVWVLLAPYFLNVFLPWSSVYSLFFSILALYLMILFLEKNKKYYLFYTGLATACTFWTRQPVGIFLFAAFIIFFIILFVFKNIKFNELFKNSLILLSGFVSISVICLIYLWREGVLTDWWVQDIVWVLGKWAFVGNGNSVHSGLLLLLHKVYNIFFIFFPYRFEIGGMFWSILPLVSIFLFTSTIIKAFKYNKLEHKESILLVILLVSLASWHQYFPQNSLEHVYWGGTLMIFVVAYFFIHLVPWYYLANFDSNRWLCFILISMSLLFVYLLGYKEIWWRLKEGKSKINKYDVQLNSPTILKNMKVETESQKIALEKLDFIIKKYIEKFPNTNLITTVYASRANLLFLTLVQNNNGFGPILTGADESVYLYSYYDYNNRLLDFIKNKKTLIYAEVPQKFDGYYELIHIKMEPEIEYMMSNEMYIYAPI